MSASELEAQVRGALEMRDDVASITNMVKHLRSVKKQLVQRKEYIAEDPTMKSLVSDSKTMIEKIDSLEGKLHNPKAQVSYDILAMRGGTKLYSVLGQLYDYAAASDGPITQGMKEMYADCKAELTALRKEFLVLMQNALPTLNASAKSVNAPHIIIPKL